MKNRKLAGYWLPVILSVTLWSGCDMHMIPLPQDPAPRGIIPEEISEEAREELERSGRFLKLINMPAHTQLSNIAAVSVANAVEDIAVLNPREPVKIFRDAQADNLSVYLPLIYTDGSEFIETGNFYVAFAIHVDAVTNYVTGVSDKTLALFGDGRATLDVRMLAEDSAAGGVIISPEEQEELEKAGHFLKIINMPANTQISNIFAVTIGNSVASIAGKDTREPARIFYTTDSSTLYIPLRNNNDSDFIENGNFYVAFSIHVDALISYTVTFEDTITVMFRDGRGTLDSTTLPSNDTDGPVITPEEKEELEKSGHFLKLINVPFHTQASNVISTAIANAHTTVADIHPAGTIKIFRDDHAATVYIPLCYYSDTPFFQPVDFNETGAFYVAFELYIDAVTEYIVTVSDDVLVTFRDGRGELDVRTLLGAGDPAVPDHRYLSITGLPSNVQSKNISEVFIYDQSGPIARCEDYQLVLADNFSNSATVHIPLRYIGANAVFSDTGAYFVSFDLNIDALHRITVTEADKIIVQFNQGNGELNVNTLPKPAEPDRRYLTISGLPANIRANNITNVFTYNQSGPIARCEDYQLVSVENSTSLRIPLSFISNGSAFTGSGGFFVSFDINIDALHKITVTKDDKIVVTFNQGNGELNVNTLPKPAEPDRRYLTISGLPANIRADNVANVFAHNQSGPIARCEDYQLVSVENSTALRIPLSFISNGSAFTGSGAYFVSFDINIDALHKITVTKDDKIVVTFNQGNGELNVNTLPKPDLRYLTISGLPANIRADNVANVFAHNQSGPIARCEDYQLVSVENSTALRIPLCFISNGSAFTGSGGFFVTFDINIDALHKISVTKDDKIVVTFNQGNGTLDVNTLPEPEAPAEIPYLTITGLPVNTAKGGFSDVFLYNAADKVAVCPDYNAIIITKNTGSVTAAIPLVFANNENDYFSLSGDFIVSFTLNVDAFTRIIKTRDDTMLLKVTGGSGVINMFNDRGYFAGGLVNPTDTAAPVIKKGTSFEMNLSYFEVKADTPIVQTMPLSNSALVYIYAAPAIGGFQFEYSTAAPEYNGTKRGYYLDNKRALYKFVFVKNTNDLYAVKTKIDDPWPALAATTLTNREDIFKNTLPVQFELSGAGNPQQRTITLPEGAYILVLRGAGGGNGWLGANGGSGGFISEMILVSNQTSARCFTGSGGTQGAAGAAPGGGGGGGSGTSVIIPDTYLLCAGGGGGSNASDSTKDHAAGVGGDGGSAGPGDSGSNGESYTTSYTDTWNGNQEPPAGWYAEHTHTTVYPGGKGGGGGGNGSASSFPATTGNAHGQGGGTAAAVSGGNNRDKLRGGGGTGGTFTTASGAGSLVIYRIF